MQNRLFFPQSAVDQWGIDGKIDLVSDDLILLAEGRRYKVEEGVRVIGEVSGAGDGHGIVGKVKPKRSLDELGAEILQDSMILGDNAYDIVPGWIGTPTSPFAAHLASADRMKARGGSTDPGTEPHSDEELMKRLVAGRL